MDVDAEHPAVPIVSAIGYWAAPGELPHRSRGLPDPRKLVAAWETKDRAAVIAYLRSGKPIREHGGFSNCRMCGLRLGTLELSDGRWAWPEKLDHYVEGHDVRLPDAFLESCRRPPAPPDWLQQHTPQSCVEGGGGVLTMPWERPTVLVDDTEWIEWAVASTAADAEPDAVTTDVAAEVCKRLSHPAWHATVSDAQGRWRIEHGGDEARQSLYVERCSAIALERWLMRWRAADSTRLLDNPRANEIAAREDGEWGGVRAIAGNGSTWLVWVRPGSAAWPTEEKVKELIKTGLHPGWNVCVPGGGRAFLVPVQDEMNWRWILTGVREEEMASRAREAAKEEVEAPAARTPLSQTTPASQLIANICTPQASAHRPRSVRDTLRRWLRRS